MRDCDEFYLGFGEKDENQLELDLSSKSPLENLIKINLFEKSKKSLSHLNTTILTPMYQNLISLENQNPPSTYLLNFIKLDLVSFNNYLDDFIRMNLSRDSNTKENSIAQKLCVVYAMQPEVDVLIKDEFSNGAYIIVPPICALDDNTSFSLNE